MDTPVQPRDLDPVAIAGDLDQQQELFGARVFAQDDLDLLRGAQRYAHTGTTVARDERRSAAIVAAKLLGWSNRRVSREMHCDIRVVGLVVELMERAGKLPPIKDRLLRAVGELTETTVERLQEMLQSDGPLDPEIAGLVKSLWVGAGIGSDKLSAPAPTLHLHQHVHQGSGLDAAKEYAARLASLTVPAPVDSVSTGLVRIGDGSSGGVADGAAGAGLDSAPVMDLVPAVQAEPDGNAGDHARAATAGDAPGRDPRGGGCARRDGRPHDDGFPRGDFEGNGGLP